MLKRSVLIAGNWKMYKTPAQAETFSLHLQEQVHGEKLGVVICPPFTDLPAVARVLAGTSLALGAQNMHWAAEGAFTGEVSGLMLRELGCRYVILGHSERRLYFGETDEVINKKLGAALNFGLCPIFCLGETLSQRESGKAEEVCLNQLFKGIENLSLPKPESLIIAYEPVWAIGTGKTAAPDDALSIIKVLRRGLAEKLGEDFAENLQILYGGSVKPENTFSFMEKEEIDGLLVGGASLDAKLFTEIIHRAAMAKGVSL